MQRLFSLFTISFILFCVLILFLTGIIVMNTPVASFRQFDFIEFYTSGAMVHNGIHTNFYDLPTQFIWQKKVPDQLSPFLMPFFYPAFVAFLFVPLSFFSYTHAYHIFGFISASIFLGSFALLIKNFARRASLYISLFIFSLLFLPIYVTIYYGQISFFWFGSLVGTWYFLKKQTPFLAGIALAFLVMKPHLLLFPLLLLLWKKQWRVLYGFFISGFVLSLISFAYIGWQGAEKYISLLLEIPFKGLSWRQFPQLEPTLRGFLQYLYHTDSLSVVLVPFLIAVVGMSIVFFYIWRGKWDTRSDVFDIQWAVLLIIMLLTSIHTFFYDDVLLLFSLLVLLRGIRLPLVRYGIGMGINILLRHISLYNM